MNTNNQENQFACEIPEAKDSSTTKQQVSMLRTSKWIDLD